jgi:hypothetical protein
MRSEGLSWEEVEETLSRVASAERAHQHDHVDEKLVKIIELGEIKNMPDEDRWLNRVADTLWIMRKDLEIRLTRLARRKPVWDGETGSYIFLR